MADVSTDEFIEICPYITDRMVEYLEHFLYSTKEFENHYIEHGNFSKSEELMNCGSDIEVWQKDYLKDVTTHVSNNAKYLEKINEEINQQRILENNVLEDITKKEEEIDDVRKKMSKINEKNKKLMDVRDKVQICKLLTNTSFGYKISNISGYVTGQASRKIDYFDLNPELLSKDEIITTLYNTVKKVSCDVKSSE